MHCETFRQNLDDLLDGRVSEAERCALEAHRGRCEACRSRYQQALALQSALRRYAPPGPDAGFHARVIRNAVRPPLHTRTPWARRAAAAGVVLAAFLAGYVAKQAPPDAGPAASVTVALSPAQTSTVQLVFDSAEALRGVELTLTLPEQVEIEGYPGRRQLSWATDLNPGRNVLRLPLVVNSPELRQAELTARLAHPSGTKVFRINALVDPRTGSNAT